LCFLCLVAFRSAKRLMDRWQHLHGSHASGQAQQLLSIVVAATMRRQATTKQQRTNASSRVEDNQAKKPV